MTHVRFALCLSTLLVVGRPAWAQQRPLVTQDPQPVAGGQVLIEAGVDAAHDAFYPLSGLTGNLIVAPSIGIVVGLNGIAEFQLTGGPFQQLWISDRQPAPLASLVDPSDSTTHAVKDIEIGTKIRLVSEGEVRPAFAFRFSTRLPNAKHASGLGQDTTDFSAALLAAKTVGSFRVAVNTGFMIMSEPLDAAKQNDLLTYGVSIACAITERVQIVGDLNGRWSTRNGAAPLGTESRGLAMLGGRYTHGAITFDSGVSFGLTAVDPTVTLTAGITYAFKAFTAP
jgi:hypothetical protein